ncbi:MAG: hypothetical protein OHK0029_15010 [Armatimonadaceae bacterium]
MPNPLIREPRNEDGYSVPLDTLECTIERVTFHNAENGYSVVKVMRADVKEKDRDKVDLVTVIGNFSNPLVGESLRLHGTWIKHPQYGHQFKLERYETLRPATAAAMEKYLGSGMVKGIGPVMAKRIVAKFGDKALDVIENTPEKLTRVSGLGEKRVEMIKKAWQEQRDVREIMLFLQGHGVTPTYAVKIYRHYKERSIEVVERNPYQLATDIWGIGFKSADRIAQNIGIAEDAPERLEAGIVYVLNDQMEGGGHCYLPRQELIKKACEILLPQTAPEGDEPASRDLAARATAIETVLDDLIARELLIEETTSFLGVQDVAIYTPAIFTTERAVAERVNQLLNSPWRNRPKPAEIDAVVDSLDGYDTLSDEQQQAVRRALSEPILVLTGGPGTGKTTTTRIVVAALEKLGRRLQLASPTGRAAKRAAEVTGKEAKTIHRLLAFDPEKRGFKHGPGEPLDLDVLIVDESSMLDLTLTHHTLRAVPDGAQVIFVGDVDQLPSVGPGNVLSDLINSGRVPVARLTQVFRQAAQSRIITNAHSINKGKIPDLLPPSAAKQGADCVFLEVEESDEIPGKVAAVVAKSLPNLGYKPDDITVLVPMQRGSVGAKNLNEVLQGVLNPQDGTLTEHQRGPIVFRVGDRVMQRVNNYDKNVYNGDVGTIVQIDKEDQMIVIQYPEGPVEYDFVDADQFVHAFSLTIHKCIAEYERVFTANRGMVPVRDLKPGDCVHTGRDGVRRVKAVIPSGKKQIVRVTTRSGYRIDVSREHPLFVATTDKGEPSWCTAENLSTEMFACIHREAVESPFLTPLPPISKLNGRKAVPPSVPTRWDEDLAYLLGLIVGDGSYRDRKDGTVDFTNQDVEVLATFRRILTGYGLRVCEYRPKNQKATRLYVVSRAFRKWLYELGLDYSCARDKGAPPPIFSAPLACRAKFLQGLFDTDGSAGTGTCRVVRLVTASETLAKEVQQLLLSLGIVSQRTQTANAWCVGVSGTALEPFQRYIGFTISYKQERLDEILQKAGTIKKTNLDIIPFGQSLASLVQEKIQNHFGASRGVKGQGLWANGQLQTGHLLSKLCHRTWRMSYRHAHDLIGYLTEKEIVVPAQLQSVVEQNYFFDAIVSVGPLNESVEMYDIEVEDVHSFVAGGGFVCHNSQGSEYPACVIAVHTQHYTMLQRNLIYTALTRAKKFAVFVGSKRAIAMAVRNRNVVPRYTRLSQRLQQLVDDLGTNGKPKPRPQRNGSELPTPPMPGRLF